MIRNGLLALVLGVVIAAGQPIVRAQVESPVPVRIGGPAVEIFAAEEIPHGARVSYRFVNALHADVLARIDSGAEYRFKHRVELVAPRKYWLSRRRVLAEAIVETGVVFDSLTQNYSLSRMLRLKVRRKADRLPPTELAQTTDSFETMRSWMTEFHGIELRDPAVDLPEGELDVRIDATLGRRFVAWIFPAPITATGQRKLER